MGEAGGGLPLCCVRFPLEGDTVWDEGEKGGGTPWSGGRWGRTSQVLYTIPQAGGHSLTQTAPLPASLG